MKIKAVIFDMDGVLIEAKDWHYEALNKALLLFGMEISLYDHLVTYDGLPTTKKLEMLSLERGLPVELHKFINEIKQQYTMEIVYTKCKPRFYHEYALSKLKLDGYKLAVGSNSVRNTVEVMLKKASLIDYMDFLISTQDVTYPKPNSQMYDLIISKLGLKPKECLIIEDNDNGVRAAIASGANVMKIKNIEDVNYYNIKTEIDHIERQQ